MITSLTRMENSVRKETVHILLLLNTGDQCSPVSEWPNETQGADLAPYLLSLQTPFM